jgi:hypothetical protein
MTLVQRRLVGLAVTLVVGAGAAGLALWIEHQSEKKEQAEAAQAKVLALSDPKSVKTLELTTPSGTFVLSREGTAAGATRWEITSPLRTPAEAFSVDGLVSALAALKRKSVVGHDGDKKLFELEPPRFRVTLTTDKGEHETLLAGKKNSFDGSLYVMREGASEVLLVDGSLEYQLDKDLFKLRDKRLVTSDTADVLKAEVSVDGKRRYTLERGDGDTWRLTFPHAVAADSTAVSTLLSALTTASATRFVVEQPDAAALHTYGLDKPKVAARLTVRAGSPLSVRLSEVSSKDAKHYYATAGGPLVELSSNWVLDKLAVDPETLRDLHVLSFSREEVGRLELDSGGKSVAFSRIASTGNDQWQMTAPQKAQAQDAPVTSLVYRLWNLKAKRIFSEGAVSADFERLGLSKPALRITLKKKDGSPLGTLSFGKVDGDEQYVRVEGTPRVDVIEASVAKDITLDPTAYLEQSTAKK